MTTPTSGAEAINVVGIAVPDNLIFVAKSVRYLSRGMRVTIDVDAGDAAREVVAWATWSRHLAYADGPGRVSLVVHGGPASVGDVPSDVARAPNDRPEP